ncbi:MAG: hypothetical protein ABIS67_15160 [Candidatus Eisenbacteria bacterium]
MTHRPAGRAGLVAALALMLAHPAVSTAQVLSNTATVTLNAVLAQSISVNIVAGSTVSFSLSNGTTASGNVPVVIQTSWNLTSTLVGAVSLYGYFSTPSQALSDGAGDNIASSSVEGRMTTGTPATFTAFSQTNPVGPASGSLALFTEAVTLLNSIKTRTDNLDLRINLTGQTIPAGSYTGTLTLQARAI